MSIEKRRYKTFLEPDFKVSQVNRQTYQRWIMHIKNGNTNSIQNEQVVDTSADLNQSSESELNTTVMDVVCNEDENIGHFKEIMQNDNCENEECDKSVNCNDAMDNDDFVSKGDFNSEDDSVSQDDFHSVDDFDLFETADIMKHDYDKTDDTIMFEAANLSISQVHIMVQALCLRYHLSDECRHALLNLIKILAGPKFSSMNTTKYTMSKKYNPPASNILYVFYCEQCYKLLLNPLSNNCINQNKYAT